MAEQDIKILTLSGRVTHKPELFQHQDGASLEFSVAVHSNRFYAKADDPEYWDIKVLGASEKLANTLEKGQHVKLTGNPQIRTYIKDGVRHKAVTVIVVDPRLLILGPKAKPPTPAQPGEAAAA